MTRELKIEFAKLRLDYRINPQIQLSEVADYADNIITEDTKDGTFLDDGAHAYLMVGRNHPHYMIAVTQTNHTSFNYKLSDGTILLEEDIEAGKFINAIKRKANV